MIPPVRVTLDSSIFPLVGASTIYLTPSGDTRMPIWNGAQLTSTPFVEMPLVLDGDNTHAGYHAAGVGFDAFAAFDTSAGVLRWGTGPGWPPGAVRGTGAGTSELQYTNQLWTNKNSMSLRFGPNAGDVLIVPAGQASYTGVSFAPVADGLAPDPWATPTVFSPTRWLMPTVDVAPAWNYTQAQWEQTYGSSATVIATTAPAPSVFDFNELIVPGGAGPGYSNPIGKTPRAVPAAPEGATPLVLILAGQSTICDSVDTAYTPTFPLKIDNLSIYDGGNYAAADPLLGAQLVRLGNHMLRTADKLIASGRWHHVVLVPVGVGGTAVGDWDASLYTRINAAIARCTAAGLTPSAICWHQGETDTMLGTSQTNYAASHARMRSKVNFRGKWIVAQASYYLGSTNAGVIAAQAAMVDNRTVFVGPNTDVITSLGRYDNIHFNALGADQASSLWISPIAAALFS